MERDLHHDPTTGAELLGELVGEGTIEGEQRPVDADGDGARQDLIRVSRGALGTNRDAALSERAAELIRAVGRLQGNSLRPKWP